ncbi:MAG: hypothetical protein WBP64_20220 [Nitrososphaeraceae archaeon]
MSRDSTVRKELYKITGEQYGLLGRISVAEVSKTLDESVKKILQKFSKKPRLLKGTKVLFWKPELTKLTIRY